MNTIDYFINQIQYAIPIEILDLALSREANSNYRLPQNIHTLIRHRILPRLITDFNITMGVEVTFNVNECTVVANSNDFTLLSIPEKILQGRDMMNIMEIISDSYSTQTRNTPLEVLERNTTGSFDASTLLKLEPISRNEFIVKAGTSDIVGTVRITVGYSNNLKEINPRYLMWLSNLAVKVAKAYIYNSLIVKLNEGKIYYGHEISIVKDIIDSYSDENSEYMEEMNVRGSKVLFMNDKESMTEFLKLTIGRN